MTFYPAYNVLSTFVVPPMACVLAAQPKLWPLFKRFAPAPLPEAAGGIWVHACSVGEINAARPLLKAIHARWPETPLLVTTSTIRGYTILPSLPEYVHPSWFPIDFRYSVRRFVSKVRPKALVLIETELWPNVLREVWRASAPVVVLNARVSEPHFRRYQALRGWLAPMFACISAVAAQSVQHAERWAGLGVPRERISVAGNVKFDAAPPDAPPEAPLRLRLEHGIPKEAPVLLFGSTRPGDEALAARCWEALWREFPDLRLVIAPRHPRRAREAAAPFKRPVLRRTQVLKGRRPAGEPILLLDTMGELAAFYAIGDLAVIGGSFYPGVEGHNPIEPIVQGVPAVFGPFMAHFADVAAALSAGGGAVQVDAPEALEPVLRRLLTRPEARAAMAEAGLAIVASQRGAVERNIEVLEAAMGQRSAAGTERTQHMA